MFALDTMIWSANYEGPQRVVMGNWSHAGMPQGSINAERKKIRGNEQHRWFDRWLKGIENGIDREPPIVYALMIEPEEWRWETALQWPPDGITHRDLFLAAGPSGSVASVNDGRLTGTLSPSGVDSYEVDPTTTSGSSSRWDNAVGAAPAMTYDGLAENDRKCLTYTTAALEKDLVVVGHPVVKLWVTSTSGDADLHLLLEEVDREGEVRYVTEGVLRASHRALREAPYDNLGLPYQRVFSGDATPLPADRPDEVVLDLHPTATVFNRGHRLRLVIMAADADNTEANERAGETTLGLFRGEQNPSCIRLPFLGQGLLPTKPR